MGREQDKLVLEMDEVMAKKKTPWDIVQISRHPNRPILQDYLSRIFEKFLELHGDRYYSDDKAMIGGFAQIGTREKIRLKILNVTLEWPNQMVTEKHYV